MRGVVLVSCMLLSASETTWTPGAAKDPADVSSDDSLCLLQDTKAAVRRGRDGLGTDVRAVPEVVPMTCEEDGGSAAFSASLQSKYFWANKNGDATCTGTSAVTSPFNVSVGPAWSFKDEGASLVRAQPCIDDEMNIYLAHMNGKVRKFTPEGELLWTNIVVNASGPRSRIKGRIPSGPVLMDGAIYVATTDGFVVSIDMFSGERLWWTKAASSSGRDTSSLMARSGVVVVATEPPVRAGNQQITALSGSDGQVLWRWTVPGVDTLFNWIGSFVDGPPSIVFSTSRGRPYRVRLCDGTTLWEGPTAASDSIGLPAPSTGGLTVGPNGIAYGTSNFLNGTGAFGLLSAFNISNGDVLWRQPQAMLANNAPSIGGLGPHRRLSVVIAIGANPGYPDPVAEASGHWSDGSPVAWASQLLAFDPATGEPTGWGWAPPPHQRPQAEGDYSPDHICLPDAWSNGAIDGSGTFFIGHMSGNVFAVRDADGNGLIEEDAGEVAKFYGGRCYQGSPGLAPGMLVTTPCDGMHVFKAELLS